MLRLRAPFVHPVTAPPIQDGAVLVDDQGKIAAVGPNGRVPAPEGAECRELRGAALVPGLVNAHTHLELTHLAGKNAEREFAAWIRTIRALKDASAPDEFVRAAEAGVRAGWAAGVTCVADTGSTGAPAAALARLGARGIAYHEVFGPDPVDAPRSLATLREALERLHDLASPRLRIGVSPHAPYSVSEPLYSAVAELARRAGLPMALHLAESPEETAFVREGRGSFADALRARGIAVTPHRVSPVRYLAELGVVSPRPACLCIHCVQVDDADIAALAAAGAAVAHCPRSNRAHGHGVAPLAAFRKAGVRVGLGTDSVVSSGDVLLWPEAWAAGLHGETALRLLTLDGARALGLDDAIGSLEIGKEADLAAFPTQTLEGAGDEATALLTIVAGRVVHG